MTGTSQGSDTRIPSKSSVDCEIHPINNERPISGSTMDTIVPRQGRRKYLLSAFLLGIIASVLFLAWHFTPHGLRIQSNSIRQAKVQHGLLTNSVVVRATANALNSVVLDSVDSGRVEEVAVEDGAIVVKGQLLFRLSNPQRNLELLARESDYATQIANRANLEVSLESSLTAHRRRLTELEFDVQQAEKKHKRSQRLVQKGFITQVTLDESKDNLEYRRRRPCSRSLYRFQCRSRRCACGR